jgi:hypothetical protein
MSIKAALQHPLAALLTVGTAVLTVLPGADVVWSLLNATAGSWFAIASVGGGIVLPQLGFDGLGTQLLFVAALVYVSIYAGRFVEGAYNWTKRDS